MPAFPDPQFSLPAFRIPAVFLLFAACARLSVAADIFAIPASSASAINDQGQVVGNSTVGNSTEAYLYQNGQFTNLGNFSATAINNAGQIVGSISTGFGSSDPVLYSGGTLTDLGNFGGGYLSFASAINNSGKIVGSATIPEGRERGFTYQNGKLTRFFITPVAAHG